MKLNDRLYLSTTADDAANMAQAYRVALEINFEDAAHMDAEVIDFWNNSVASDLPRRKHILHLPHRALMPMTGEGQMRKLMESRLDQAYLVARYHGISRINLHSGFMPGFHNAETYLRHAVPFWLNYLRNKPMTLKVTLENVYEEDPTLLVRLIRAIDDPRIGLCLDVGHAYLHPGVPLDQWIDECAPYLTHVHLNDNDGIRNRHWPLGDGFIDLEKCIQRIERCAPAVTYTIETLLCKPSLQWLTQRRLIEKQERVTMYEHLYFGWL